MNNEKRPGKWHAWILAARPKTLSGAAVPVLMGLALAFSDAAAGWFTFQWVPALLCLLFAFAMQVDANLINDYVDFLKGTDTGERLGPLRATAQGWISERSMRWGIGLTTLIAGAIGLPLVLYGGWWLVGVGALCVLFAFLYTTHFSYWGLGDVLVLVFFGIVPVCFTYYVQAQTITPLVFIASVACGLVIDTLLVVNNYRDREGDRLSGKRTLVVRQGKRRSELLYLALGCMGVLLGLAFLLNGRPFTFFLPLVYLCMHVRTYRSMVQIGSGRALNGILAANARNMFLFGLLFSLGAIVDCLW